MLFDVILAVIAIIGIAVALTILIRKFPSLGAIDTNSIPQEREARTKNDIIEKRLQRKFSFIGQSTVGRLEILVHRARIFFRQIYWRLREFEQTYRRRAHTPDQATDQNEVRSKVGQLVDDAERLISEEKFIDAEKRCVEAIALDPKNTEIYHCLGELYLKIEDYGHAREVIEHCINILRPVAQSFNRLTPAQKAELGELHIDLSQALRGLGLTDEAIAECEAALKLVPNNPKYLNSLLETAITAQKKLLALRTLDRLKAANPENNKLEELETQVKNL